VEHSPQKIGIHTKNNGWTYVDYNLCTLLDRTASRDIDLIHYPRRTTCNTYADANCTKQTSTPTIFGPGNYAPAIEDGYGMCEVLE
jgi:hypothetical protein